LRVFTHDPSRDIYLRFLQLTDALRCLPSLPALAPRDERILARGERASQSSERLAVREMMTRSELCKHV
jgi:hypothetical protein